MNNSSHGQPDHRIFLPLYLAYVSPKMYYLQSLPMARWNIYTKNVIINNDIVTFKWSTCDYSGNLLSHSLTMVR